MSNKKDDEKSISELFELLGLGSLLEASKKAAEESERRHMSGTARVIEAIDTLLKGDDLHTWILIAYLWAQARDSYPDCASCVALKKYLDGRSNALEAKHSLETRIAFMNDGVLKEGGHAH